MFISWFTVNVLTLVMVQSISLFLPESETMPAMMVSDILLSLPRRVTSNGTHMVHQSQWKVIVIIIQVLHNCNANGIIFHFAFFVDGLEITFAAVYFAHHLFLHKLSTYFRNQMLVKNIKFLTMSGLNWSRNNDASTMTNRRCWTFLFDVYFATCYIHEDLVLIFITSLHSKIKTFERLVFSL